MITHSANNAQIVLEKARHIFSERGIHTGVFPMDTANLSQVVTEITRWDK